MHPRKTTFKAFVALVLSVFSTFTIISKRNNRYKEQKVAAAAAFGDFSLPDSTKRIFVHPTLGNDSASGTTAQNAVQTLPKALQNSPNGGAILLLDDMTISSTFTVSKDITIASSPVLMDGSANAQVFTITRDAASIANMFNINGGIELHLTNIIIDGNRAMTNGGAINGTIFWVGTNHVSFQGNLYLHEGSVIQGGNRTLGGGVVILQKGLLYMNGGIIRNNFQTNDEQNEYPIVGGVEGSSNNKLHLIAGEIRDNISPSYIIYSGFPNTSELYIGADFLMENNGPDPSLNYLPFQTTGTHIVNNYTSPRTFYVEGVVDERINGLIIVDEALVPLNPQPAKATFFKPYNDPSLYAEFDPVANAYFWKSSKIYSANHEIILKPTATSEGILGRKAYLHDDENGAPVYDEDDYIDVVTLPTLGSPAYQNVMVDAGENEIRYLYTHEGQMFILTYLVPQGGFIWRVITTPTDEDGGSLHKHHDSYPGAIFATAWLPPLSSSDYDIEVMPNNINYTYTDNLGALHTFSGNRPIFGYIGEIKVMPTATSGGSADVLHPDFPGAVFGTIVLPVLNDSNYDMSIGGGKVTYSYFHNMTSVLLNVEIPIPGNGYYVDIIMVTPTSESIGVAILKHPEVPDYKRSISLPILNASDYAAVIVPDLASETGTVRYTYFDESTATDIIFMHAYDYDDLVWNVGIDPTLTANGTIIGTSSSLPGADFTIELPILSSEFYTIQESAENITYTLKDTTYGAFVFTIANQQDPEPNDGTSGETSYETSSNINEETNDELLDEKTRVWPYLIVVGSVLFFALGGTGFFISRKKKR